MSATGLDVFDKTLHSTHLWLDEIMAAIGPDRQLAWHVLGSVLRALRDRLDFGLSAHLSAQLPLLVRGLYFDQWQPKQPQAKWRSLDEFLAVLAPEFQQLRPVDPQAAAAAVFQVLDHYLDPGQIAKVKQALPEDIRQLWPENGRQRLDSAA